MDGYFDQDGRPQVIIKLEGLTKEVISINCLIDTGFDGYLTLTQATEYIWVYPCLELLM